MSFFDVTAEEIEEANKSMDPDFKDGEIVKFLVKELTAKDDYRRLSLSVLSGDSAGKNHSVFFRNNPYSKRSLISFMQAVFTPEQIAAKQMSEVDVIGKQVESKCRVKIWNDKKQYNFDSFVEVKGDAPSFEEPTNEPTVDDIPF